MKLFHFTLPLLLALGLQGFQAKGQSSCGPFPNLDNCKDCISLSLSTTSVVACPGVAVPITPTLTIPTGFTVLSYTWTPTLVVLPTTTGPGAPPVASITPPTAIPTPPCGLLDNYYTLNVTGLGPNIIMNGDFSLGNTDFCSTFFYVPPGTLSSPNPIANPDYTVCDNAGDMTVTGVGPIPPFLPYPGDPNMFLIVPDPNPTYFWQQVVTVCQGASYQFSFEVADLIPSAMLGQTYVTITDASGATTTFPASAISTYNIWNLYTCNWTNPVGASFTFATVTIWGTLPAYNVVMALDNISMNRTCIASATTDIVVDYSSISGPSKVCVGNTAVYTPCTLGGTWSSSNTSIATVDALGNVTGISTGIAVISYTDIYGCTSTITITVLALPVISGGPSNICLGGSVSLTATPSGGTWTTDPIFGYTSPGNYAGNNLGIGNIYYTGTDGCTAEFTVTVNPYPDPIPDYYICTTDIITLSPVSPYGGTWSPPLTPFFSLTTGGILSGIAPGSAPITYTSPAGCARTTTVNVYDCSHGVIVGGGGNLCTNSYTTLVGLPAGGTWSSSSPCATIGATTGVVSAVPCGSTVPVLVTFTYTVGTIVTTTTLLIVPATTACVTVDYSALTDYTVNFTSNCSGTATFYYSVFDPSWNPLSYAGIYYTLTTTSTSIPWTTIASWFGPDAFYICVNGVECNGCYYPAYCCAHPNPAGRFATGGNGNGGASNYEGELKVLPNPNTGSFQVAGTLPGNATATEAQIEIVNLLGQVVYKDLASVNYGIVNKDISLGDQIANGVYMLKIRNGDASQVIQFVLNR